MLVPSSVSRVGAEMTDAQHREFETFLERHVEHDACRRDPLMFALMLAGDKPAIDYEVSEWEFPNYPFAAYEGLLELCDHFDLAYRRIGPGVGDDWFIAPSPGRLDLLPSTNRVRVSPAWHRRFGVILGYPPEAIEFFITSHWKDRTQPEELVASGVFTAEEMAHTQFTFYVHEDSIEGYERAIGTGKTVRGRISELADEWDLPALNAIADDVYDEGIRMLRTRAKAETSRARG